MKLKSGIYSILSAVLLALLVFVNPVYASPAVKLTVKTVIDNAGEIPASAANKEFNYNVTQIVNFVQREGRSNWAIMVPSINSRNENFTWKNGGTKTFSFVQASGKDNVFAFQPSSNTDAQISLTSVEYGRNTRSYTYNDNGRARKPVVAFNWAEVTGGSGTVNAEVTLHFRYNPKIGEVDKEPEPNPSYTKKIDYLGDGKANPDTSVQGDNVYRLYLDLTTEPQEKEANKDIIFLLDNSNSMKEMLGTQNRLTRMKATVNSAIDILTKNPENRISIVEFETNVRTLRSWTNDASSLKSAVNAITSPGNRGGGTNYYDGLINAGKEISKLMAADRETVIFFLTDGKPTAATSVVNASGYDRHTPIALLYAVDAASAFPKVDRFYSVFIGNDTGDASTLQTVTQKISVSKEKFMVQATSAQELSNTFERFISRLGKELYHVKIEDYLSEYVDYAFEPKLVRVSDGQTTQLSSGVDYNFSYNDAERKVNMELLDKTIAASRYILSFNIKASDKALNEYDIGRNYNATGDAGTDYPGNATSSGKSGFFSNTEAKLSYEFQGGRKASKTYPKPVIQVKLPEVPPKVPSEDSLKAEKQLEGRALKEDMFEFVLKDKTSGAELAKVTNDASGNIVFDNIAVGRAGLHTLELSEVIPSDKIRGMTYDENKFKIGADVKWKDGELIVSQFIYDDTLVFKNKYEPQPIDVTLTAEKQLEGRALKPGEFSFILKDDTDTTIETVQNAADGKITFAPLTFKKAGEYRYNIREQIPVPADSHITYDWARRDVLIKITDEDGVLEAEVTYSPDNVFKNIFTYKPADADIKVKKVMKGMRLDGISFEFELRSMETGDKWVSVNDANGDVFFSGIKFENPGIYTYEVRELLPDNPDEYITYDTEKVISITVEVTDDGSGDLKAETTYSEDPVFYNTYKIKGGIR